MNEEDEFFTNGNKKGGNKAVIIIMGLIIIALSAALVYLLLTRNEKKNNEEEVPDNKFPKEYAIMASDIEFPQYSCGGIDFSLGTTNITINENGTTDTNTYYVNQMSAKEKLGMVATEMIERVERYESDKLKDEKIYEGIEIGFDITFEVKKYFYIDEEMEKQIEEGFGTGFYVFYKKDNKSYVKLIIGGCTAPDNEGYYIKFKEKKQIENLYIKTYYYAYAKNDHPVKVIDNEPHFTASYYKSPSDETPVVKNLESRDNLNYELFNTFDVYYDISDGMKLIKIVYNKK